MLGEALKQMRRLFAINHTRAVTGNTQLVFNFTCKYVAIPRGDAFRFQCT